MSSEGELRIGEVAKLAGTTPRTIRYYEEIGLLAVPGARRPGAHRTYAANDVDRLTELLRLKDLLGLTLEELKELAHSQSLAYLTRQLEMVRRRREEITKLEKELLGALESAPATH